MIHDLRIAFRSLRKSPAFTFAAVATLALAMGAATAVFSIARVVLLDPLPYADPDRLVRIIGTSDGDQRYDAISYPDYRDAVAQSGAFENAAAYDEWSPSLTGAGEPEMLVGGLVEAAFFDVLGVRPASGRFFNGADNDAVVISHSLWQRRFGGQGNVIGRRIHVDGEALTIAGITAADFTHPYLSDDTRPIDIWTTLNTDTPRRRRSRQFTAIARLKHGITIEQAAARVATVGKRLQQIYPDDNAGRGMSVVPLHARITSRVRQPIWLLFGSVVLLLLIACVNVASLMLARTSARAADTAVHAVLGATPRQLVLKLLAETLILGTAGAVAGLALAQVIVRQVVRAAMNVIPRAADITIDVRVALFALVTGLVAALLVGAIPAVRVRSLRGKVRGATDDASSLGAHASMVVVQVALSVVLLMAATLVGRSLWNLLGVDGGFDDRGAVVFEVRAPARYDTWDGVRRFYSDLESRMLQIPGVSAAGATTILPLDGDFNCTPYVIDGSEQPCAEERTITPGYLRAIGIPLIEGRGFTDRNEPVLIIDEAFARKHWPNESAIGRRITMWDASYEIIGVARAARILALGEQPVPTVYLSSAQARPKRSMTVVMRTNAAMETLAPAIRDAVHSVSPDVPIVGLRTMQTVVRDSAGAQRLRGVLLAIFGVAALLLASVGVAGMLAINVVRRKRELGVRIALGATANQIAALVIARGMRMIAIGLAVGALLSLATNRLLQSLLFGVAATDLLSFGIVASLLAVAGLIATAVPAMRAAATDPLAVIRAE